MHAHTRHHLRKQKHKSKENIVDSEKELSPSPLLQNPICVLLGSSSQRKNQVERCSAFEIVVRGHFVVCPGGVGRGVREMDRGDVYWGWFSKGREMSMV